LIDIWHERLDRGSTTRVGGRCSIYGGCSVIPTADLSFFPPDPNRSTVVFGQGVPKPASQSIVFTVTLHLCAFDLAEWAFVVTNAAPRSPDPAVTIFDHAVIASIMVRDRNQLTVLQLRQTYAGSNPQTAIARTEERQSAAGMKSVNTIVPRFEVDAVEADQPIERAYPEETVSRLRDGNR
jgi:hypothetical protein